MQITMPPRATLCKRENDSDRVLGAVYDKGYMKAIWSRI